MKFMEGMKNDMNGKLYLVPTPIGNLKDMTLRGLEVLKAADIIAAEDTRQTIKLLNHFNIKKFMISYHKHNEQSKGDEIISELKNGKSIAIVTDAGTPGISDPGSVVVEKCIKEEIDFEVLPGATAITTALVYSGLNTTRFLFRGFIPRETKERKILLEEIKNVKDTVIFYESPYRIKSTLEMLLETLGDRNIALCRELTKLYEEIKRGKISDVMREITDINVKGELVLVVDGKKQEEIDKENQQEWEKIDIDEHIDILINQGLSKKEAIKEVAKVRKLRKNEVYKYSINKRD